MRLSQFINAHANVLTVNSGRVRLSRNSRHGTAAAHLESYVLVPWLLSSYSKPLTPASPLVNAATNPKSLPASPWRPTLAKQMASVCWAAIKKGRVQWREWERKWVRIKGKCGRLHFAARPQYKHTFSCTRCVRTHKHTGAFVYTPHATLPPRSPRSPFPNKNKCPLYSSHITKAQQESWCGLKALTLPREKPWAFIPPQNYWGSIDNVQSQEPRSRK